jgi:hypothetical protein
MQNSRQRRELKSDAGEYGFCIGFGCSRAAVGNAVAGRCQMPVLLDL